MLSSREKTVKRDPGNRELYRRHVHAADLVSFEVIVKETDLLVLSETDLSSAIRDLVVTHRYRLECFIAEHPDFLDSLVPVAVPETAPPIVKAMADAARAAGVGPMAAVAGAISDAVAEGLGGSVSELIIENGGDLYVATARERTVGIFSGESTTNMALGLRIEPGETPIGICTSSGRLGHSHSFGDSAAATLLARSSAIADAAATAVGNRVRGRDGIREGLKAAREIPGVLGAVLIRDGQVGAWGDVELVAL